MADQDRERWDERYQQEGQSPVPGLPSHFQPCAERFAQAGSAVDIACGVGRASVWLAQQGIHITGFDISPVAIAHAKELARTHGVAHRCTFEVADLDAGLPEGPPVDLVLCNMFRNPGLDGPMMERLNPMGTLAIAALSEVGAAPGRFRCKPGELVDAFAQLELVATGEDDGVAWVVGVTERPV